MKKTKKVSGAVVAIVLVLVLSIGAFASGILVHHTKIGIFKGHVEHIDRESPRLLMRIGDTIVESNTIGFDKESVFPVLSGVHFEDGAFVGDDGKDVRPRSAIATNAVTLVSENGTINNISYKITMSGDTSVASAMRFIAEFGYKESEHDAGCGWVNQVQLTPQSDGTYAYVGYTPDSLTPGSELQVRVWAYVDYDAIYNLESYTEGEFRIDLDFWGDSSTGSHTANN